MIEEMMNRENISITDIRYYALLRKILDEGILKKNRTGVDTLSIFGYNTSFDLTKGFPLLTTKKIYTKGMVHELLWFLRGETNIKYLVDNDTHIWDAWANEYGELGPIYGKQWTKWEGEFSEINQIEKCVDLLKKDPDNRRILVSAWNVKDLPEMALAPCHYSFQFYSHENNGNRYLSLLWNQRSVDTFLGLPFNIASYALLCHMMAQVTGHIPYRVIFNGGDTHLYVNHIEQAKEQLLRDPTKYEPPTLKLNPDIKNIFDFKYEDIVFEKYESYPAIKAPIAV